MGDGLLGYSFGHVFDNLFRAQTHRDEDMNRHRDWRVTGEEGKASERASKVAPVIDIVTLYLSRHKEKKKKKGSIRDQPSLHGKFLERGHEQRGFNIPFTFEGLNDLFWGSDIGRMFVLARLSGAFVARSSPYAALLSVLI